jgi:phage antirepressor YoqD-like protein
MIDELVYLAISLFNYISSNSINIYPIESLIQWLTERQYQYEIAYYDLASNNVFPNFAKLLHERSEEKYVVEFLRKNHFVFSRYDDI